MKKRSLYSSTDCDKFHWKKMVSYPGADWQKGKLMSENNNFSPFTDDFIFALVMRNTEICKGLLERIIPEVEFGEIRLTACEHPLFGELPLTVEQQKTLKFDMDAKGVRFDAYAKSENMWAEVEMQTYRQEHLGKRSRYYHSNMNLDGLEAGKPYGELKRSYVIFICTFDYMKAGKAVYFFQTYDVKNELYFDDETYTIILNTRCAPENVPDRLKPLFAYINNADTALQDPFIRSLDQQVQKYSTPEWRAKQMTLEHLLELREKRGLEQGKEQLSLLIQKLLEEDRLDDIKKVTTDAAYRELLFIEYNL